MPRSLRAFSHFPRVQLLEGENKQLQDRTLQLSLQVGVLERALRTIHVHSLEVWSSWPRTCLFPPFPEGRRSGPDSPPGASLAKVQSLRPHPGPQLFSGWQQLASGSRSLRLSRPRLG